MSGYHLHLYEQCECLKVKYFFPHPVKRIETFQSAWLLPLSDPQHKSLSVSVGARRRSARRFSQTSLTSGTLH